MAAISSENRGSVFPTFVWGFILFCFFGLLAIVAVRYFGDFQSYENQRADERSKKLAEYRETMKTDLNTLKWADKEKQTVQVPLAAAMRIARNELSRKKVGASSVSVVPPAAPAAPAESDEAAAGATESSESDAAEPAPIPDAAPASDQDQSAPAIEVAPTAAPEPSPSPTATPNPTVAPTSSPTAKPTATAMPSPTEIQRSTLIPNSPATPFGTKLQLDDEPPTSVASPETHGGTEADEAHEQDSAAPQE